MKDIKKYNIIPIGNDCSISHFLRDRKLREHALPFDWNVTPIKSSIDLIKNDFNDFLNLGNLVESEPTGRLLFDEKKEGGLKISEEIITPVLCKKYQILLPHDFSSKGLKELDEIKAKYERRIERFYNLLSVDMKPVIFIAANGKLNSWQLDQYNLHKIQYNNDGFGNWKNEIKSVLDSKFPNLEYHLIDYLDFVKENDSLFHKGISRIKRMLK